MAEKRKTSVETKIAQKRTSKAQESQVTVKPSESNPAADPRGTGIPQQKIGQTSDSQVQLKNFEAAMKLFHARRLREARALFELAVQGPERDVANRAGLHRAMCDRRLEQEKPALHTAEDYYNYGIALLNTRKVADARAYLEQALAIAPGADHVHYALALALALDGDLANAYENLRRAIELEPHNRILARQDADFAPLANQPPFDALLYPEKKGW